MDQWTYNILVVDMAGVMGNKPSITKMWEVRGPDGLTDWDRLAEHGARWLGAGDGPAGGVGPGGDGAGGVYV